MSDKNILARCCAIASSPFLNTPYKNVSAFDWYASDGVGNKAAEICHYCTADILNAILTNNCLRFTDVRFLNDSTEFIEIIPLISTVVSRGNYEQGFKELILNSNEFNELKEYKQPCIRYLRTDHNFVETSYRTYTCSFSTNSDSLRNCRKIIA